VRVKVFDASANEALAAVASGEAEFGLNFMGSQETGIEFKPLLEDRFVAACRRDHPLASTRQATWADLSAYDYISVSKASGNRLLLDQALAHVSGRPQSIYEAQHVTTMLGLVEAGLGVAAVPSLAMPAADHPLLVSVPLVGPVVTRRVGLIRRKGRPLSPSAQQLYDFLLGDEAGTQEEPSPRASQCSCATGTAGATRTPAGVTSVRSSPFSRASSAFA
jgi:DNA-binding transcriptional LysR family regulator